MTTAQPITIHPDFVREFAHDFVRQGPIARVQTSAEQVVPTFALSPHTSFQTLAEISRRLTSYTLQTYPNDTLVSALEAAYEHRTTQSPLSNLSETFDTDVDLSQLLQDIPQIEDLQDNTESAPIIRMINVLFRQAQRDGASDIHIEPFEQYSIVRFRVDGTMRDIVRPPKGLHSALISRIKIMAQLDIAEKRLPQDGRISIRIQGRALDVRVSTLPTGHGERAVMRLLDKEMGRLDLSHLGMNQAMLESFRQLTQLPHGIILVTGPTGSGKTTTLYASLAHMDAARTNIMTVEDPIEYDLAGIGQTQVNSKIEMNFARALRAILRQDPDVIMIGEIRDLETAQIAVQASLTGHLVLATLHTNDASSAITRLVDMGIEPFLLASSLSGVLAQRLVRKLCPDCKLPDEQGAPHTFIARGCRQCNGIGYLGRTGVYELLTVDNAIRAQIHDQASDQAIRETALEHGMISMHQDGARWVEQGVTSQAEILRATRL